MIDSHCHLADRAFAPDLDMVIRRAMDARVKRMVTIGDSLPESEACIRIAETYGAIYATAGVHPHHAKAWREGDGEKLKALVASSSNVRAIGEIGLDYHYDFSPRDVQRAVFNAQLMLARELGMPAVVHCREAVDDVWAIVDEIRPETLVLHCCTEKFADAARFLERGYFLSFTGIATYPTAGEIRETIRHTPLEQLMVETDAPYLAPVPHRRKRNEPAFVVEVAKLIAEVKGVTLGEVDARTTENAEKFFNL